MAIPSERRRWQRRSLSTTVLFRLVDGPGGPFRSAKMRDISDGGVAFDTDDPPSEGALIDMFFKEQSDAADRRVRGRVAWMKPSEGGLYNVGVSFTA
jgi:hypothetical protein